MHNVFQNYPFVPWEPNWRLASSPEDAIPWTTTDTRGHLATKEADWSLQLIDPSQPITTRLLHNGLSIGTPSQDHHLIALATADGVLTGSTQGLPLPQLVGKLATRVADHETWISTSRAHTLLLCEGQRFALIAGEDSETRARERAVEALAIDLEAHVLAESKRRQAVAQLLDINPRHNPPIALAAETLYQRLRGPAGTLRGRWSVSDQFEQETFSLNELYPLTRAWSLIDPAVAMALVETALETQRPSGEFPAWVDHQGLAATVAPWPLILQSFEQAWLAQRDPNPLKKHLPALRKYIQWALRHFDPHRDQIPAWQSQQEEFIPGNFERDKATPELTAFLIGELHALIRLCQKNKDAQSAIAPLREELDRLEQTLHRTFWNPATQSFSNCWKNGHTRNEPTFGSFAPLLVPDLPEATRKALLERFDKTHSFPSDKATENWQKEPMDDPEHLPAIHQFIALEALRRSDARRASLLLFARRTRDGFATWFERERIHTARREANRERPDQHLFALGPVTAALILATQKEFQRDEIQRAPLLKLMLRCIHRWHLSAADVRIALFTALAILLIHLLYNLSEPDGQAASLSEAALNYKQGKLADALSICQQYPDAPLSRFLQANLMMLTDQPEKAKELYLAVLREQIGSPSALFGYALALQRTGDFDLAIRRYNDFIDIYEAQLGQPDREDLIDLANEFLRQAEERFRTPPQWNRAYALPIMNDLGL